MLIRFPRLVSSFAIAMSVLCIRLCEEVKAAQATEPTSGAAVGTTDTTEESRVQVKSNQSQFKRTLRVGVLSAVQEPKQNTSQGLFLKILREAGCEASAVSAEQVRNGSLDKLDLFIIGGGSGTKFNSSLGEAGGELVEEFVRKGGGVMGSCAGGYSFVLGHNEALRHIEIANARCIDTQGGRWARGKGTVQIAPVVHEQEAPEVAGRALTTIKMFYANGPLWEIGDRQEMGRIEVLARFQTDIHPTGDVGGVMLGTPAIIAGSYGDGRYVLFSAHPEFHQSLGNYPLVVDAAKWVTRGPLSEQSPISWQEVFPTARRSP